MPELLSVIFALDDLARNIFLLLKQIFTHWSQLAVADTEDEYVYRAVQFVNNWKVKGRTEKVSFLFCFLNKKRPVEEQSFLVWGIVWRGKKHGFQAPVHVPVQKSTKNGQTKSYSIESPLHDLVIRERSLFGNLLNLQNISKMRIKFAKLNHFEGLAMYDLR